MRNKVTQNGFFVCEILVVGLGNQHKLFVSEVILQQMWAKIGIGELQQIALVNVLPHLLRNELNHHFLLTLALDFGVLLVITD